MSSEHKSRSPLKRLRNLFKKPPAPSEHEYGMTIGLNELTHLGLSLYNNTPAVLAEMIANAWDADATDVQINFDRRQNTITVTDNGVGMDQDDINTKYLYVGYQKREQTKGVLKTRSGRLPMGRKGIGKLSLFSIAEQVTVYSKKADGPQQALLIDVEDLKAAIKNEDPSSPSRYHPKPIEFDVDLGEHGTCIRIAGPKNVEIITGTVSAFRERMVKRFGIIGVRQDFKVSINGKPVTLKDRNYFHKAQFIFQYGSHDYASHCRHLDKDEKGKPLSSNRGNRFDAQGVAKERGVHEVKGWIAIAHNSNDLDGQGQGNNLNRITITVRGKVALDDILREYRLGGMITKYIFGEINADFLDDDAKPDIATSSRQGIAEADPRYLALRTFLERELKHISTRTNRLKDRKGLEQALASNPHIKDWYENLPKHSQNLAKKIFGAVDKAGVDEERKQGLYADGVLAFEALKLNSALDKLNQIDETNLNPFLRYLVDVNSFEAARCYKIVQERLEVIEKLQEMVDENLKERALQEHIFKELWLFDPAWDRATGESHMEERLQRVVGDVPNKRGHVRLDIRYRSVPGTHVIIELKRARRPITTGEIQDQINAYIYALRAELTKTEQAGRFPIEGVCLLNRLPSGWDNLEIRQQGERSLAVHGIRVMTYTGLIESARSRYRRFSEASEEASDQHQLIEKIRSYGTMAASDEVP